MTRATVEVIEVTEAFNPLSSKQNVLKQKTDEQNFGLSLELHTNKTLVSF